ncbi:hypothetical protein [Phenylobacterium sp.]
MRKTETVYPWEVALLYVNGTFRRTLPPETPSPYWSARVRSMPR